MSAVELGVVEEAAKQTDYRNSHEPVAGRQSPVIVKEGAIQPDNAIPELFKSTKPVVTAQSGFPVTPPAVMLYSKAHKKLDNAKPTTVKNPPTAGKSNKTAKAPRDSKDHHQANTPAATSPSDSTPKAESTKTTKHRRSRKKAKKNKKNPPNSTTKPTLTLPTLPSDILKQIIAHTVTHTGPINVTPFFRLDTCNTYQSQPLDCEPHILHASALLYREGAPAFYALNIFSLDLDPWVKYPRTLGGWPMAAVAVAKTIAPRNGGDAESGTGKESGTATPARVKDEDAPKRAPLITNALALYHVRTLILHTTYTHDGWVAAIQILRAFHSLRLVILDLRSPIGQGQHHHDFLKRNRASVRDDKTGGEGFVDVEVPDVMVEGLWRAGLVVVGEGREGDDGRGGMRVVVRDRLRDGLRRNNFEGLLGSDDSWVAWCNQLAFGLSLGLRDDVG